MSTLKCTVCGSSVVMPVTVSVDADGVFLDTPSRVVNMCLADQRALRARHKSLGENGVAVVGVCVKCGRSNVLTTSAATPAECNATTARDSSTMRAEVLQ